MVQQTIEEQLKARQDIKNMLGFLDTQTENEGITLLHFCSYKSVEQVPGGELEKLKRLIASECKTKTTLGDNKHLNALTPRGKQALYQKALLLLPEVIERDGKSMDEIMVQAEYRHYFNQAMSLCEFDPVTDVFKDFNSLKQEPKRAKPTAAKTKRKPGKKQPKPPESLEEVKAYCKARNNNIDPQRFWDYYTAAEPSWHDKDGKPVLSWKQRIISWERSGGPPSSDTGIVGRGSNAQPAGRVPSGTDFLADNKNQ